MDTVICQSVAPVAVVTAAGVVEEIVAAEDVEAANPTFLRGK
jgi:hypothetical protein